MDYHTTVSYIKSLVRVIGYMALLVNIPVGAITLIGAELLGIAEEIKWK
jgi:hypothetical protein